MTLQHAYEILDLLNDDDALASDILLLRALLQSSPTEDGKQMIADDIVDMSILAQEGGDSLNERIADLAEWYHKSLLIPSKLSCPLLMLIF